MKKMMLLAFLTLPVLGCLSTEDRQALREEGVKASAEIDALTAQANDLVAKYQAGTISLADMTAALAQINGAKEMAISIKEKVDERLAGRPWYEQVEAWLQILVGAGLAFTGNTAVSRLSRGAPLFKLGATRKKG